MLAWVGGFEALRQRVADGQVSGSRGLALPVLPGRRSTAGTYRVQSGLLAVAVSEPLAAHVERVPEVSGRLEVDADRRVRHLELEVAMASLGRATGGFEGETLYALHDAAGGAKARFVAGRVTAAATPVPGVSLLRCDGTLSCHGVERFTRLELLLAVPRRDRLRLQGRLAVDVRDFGLPRSWCFGFLPVDPVVTVFLDATLQREAKVN